MKTNLEPPAKIYIAPPRPCRKAGKRWSDEEQAYLVKAVRRGDHLFRICDLLSRPYLGVLSKLQQLRIISWKGYIEGHQWRPLARRTDPIPRSRDAAFFVRQRDVEKLYRIAREIGAEVKG